MKKLIMLLMGLSLSGCVSQKSTIPEIETFKKICQEKYVLHINDCSNMAGKYARKLLENGKEARVIVLKQKNKNAYHAIVETYYEGRKIYLDPSGKKVTNKIEDNFLFAYEVPLTDLYWNSEYINPFEREKGKKRLEGLLEANKSLNQNSD